MPLICPSLTNAKWMQYALINLITWAFPIIADDYCSWFVSISSCILRIAVPPAIELINTLSRQLSVHPPPPPNWPLAICPLVWLSDSPSAEATVCLGKSQTMTGRTLSLLPPSLYHRGDVLHKIHAISIPCIRSWILPVEYGMEFQSQLFSASSRIHSSCLKFQSFSTALSFRATSQLCLEYQ